jgi:hypothetical protein
MELTAYFDEFLKNEVNLNQDRIDTIDEKVSVVENLLKDNEIFKKYFKGLTPQGSYAQKTIIKPPKDKDFDVDILLQLQTNDKWEPKDYVQNLFSVFSRNDKYKKITDINTKCITINYKGDFHVDLVPCVERGGKIYITNKDENKWEQTNPEAYTQWLMKKNSASYNYLIKTIRLFKYLRDIKGNFSVKSILLNTLLGNCINDSEAQSDFKNLPTAFIAVFQRLDIFLQNNVSVPTITNPTLSTEDFNRHWDQEKYSNFREKINTYFNKAKQAYDEDDRSTSIQMWQDIFGDAFPASIEENEKTKAFGILSGNSRPWST